MSNFKPGVLIDFNNKDKVDRIRAILKHSLEIRIHVIAKEVGVTYSRCESILRKEFKIQSRDEEAIMRDSQCVTPPQQLEEAVASSNNCSSSSHPSNPNSLDLGEKVALKMQFLMERRHKLLLKIKKLKPLRKDQKAFEDCLETYVKERLQLVPT